ncbi:TetR family transcriptional regulator, partial [Rhizobium johnstonii]
MAAKRSGAEIKGSGRRGASPQSGHEPRSEPTLSLERIVATAVDLLDAYGVDGLKMRRLADRLGAGAMRIHWYVDNNETVFALAVDSV